MEAGADLNYDYFNESGVLLTPLLAAIEIKNRPCIAFLVQKGASFYFPERKDLSPLFQAIKTQDLGTIQTLIVNARGDLAGIGSLVNSEGLNVMHQACKYSSREIVAYLA